MLGRHLAGHRKKIEMKVIDSIWFNTLQGVCGLVVGENERGERKIYAGVVSGFNQKADEEEILSWGNKVSISLLKGLIDKTKSEVAVVGTPIKELRLPYMYRNRLERNGIRTVEQLTEMSRRQLYSKRLIGQLCISLVEEALSHMELSLAADE